MSGKYTFYSDTISLLSQEDKLRHFTPITPISGAYIYAQGKRKLSFCSQDYLSLTQSHEVKKRAIQYLLEHGVAVPPESDQVYLSCQERVEKKLAKALDREAALLFSSRADANISLLSTIGHPAAALFIHKDAHPSFLAGAKEGKGSYTTFTESTLEELLEKEKSPYKIVATESIFSKTGEPVDLPALVSIVRKQDALLVVDDSHALGVTGVEGMGLAASLPDVDIITGSLNKGMGVYGGFIACKETIRSYLLSLMLTLKQPLLPPPILGAIDAALDLIPDLEGERKQLHQRCHWLRAACREKGYAVSLAQIPLLSLPFSSDKEAEKGRAEIEKHEIQVGPVRAGRLQVALTVCHAPDHLDRLASILPSPG